MLNIYHYRLEKGVYKKLEITNQVQNIFSFSIRVITSLTAQSGGSTQVSLKSSEALLDQRPLAFLRDYPWPFLGDCPWSSLGTILGRDKRTMVLGSFPPSGETSWKSTRHTTRGWLIQ